MEPEALSPNKSTETSPISNLEVIPISLSVEDSSVQATTGLLESFEKSIRSFSFQSATIRWTNQVMGVPQLELSAQAFAFYTEQVQASESQKTIYASQDAKKGGTAMSSSSDNGEDE